MKNVAGIITALACTLGSAHAAEDCIDISNDERRLACYDAEYRPAQTVTKESVWNVTSSTSKIDDSTSVYLRVDSEEPVATRIGRRKYPQLWVRCKENTTAVILSFDGHHMTDSLNYGQVTLRIDDQPARTRSMYASTDSSSLGLWNGGSSIPLIQQMFGHDMLTVRVTPYSENAITTQFPITGLEQAIQPLREACHW